MSQSSPIAQSAGSETALPARWKDIRIPPLILLMTAAAIWIPQNQRLLELTTGELEERSSLYLFDIPMAAICIVQARGLLAALRRKDPLLIATFALIVLVGVSVAFNFSPRGAERVFRLVLAVGFASAVARLPRTPGGQIVCWTAAAMAVFESVLAAAELVKGDTLGLSGLGEINKPQLIGENLASYGTFNHPYVLAAWAAVMGAVFLCLLRLTRDRRWALIAAAAVVPLGLTNSRAGALSGAILFVGLALGILRDRQIPKFALAALAVGLAVPVAFTLDGWVGRAKEPISPPVGGRVTMSQPALEFAQRHPIVGVGAGRYELAAREELGAQGDDVVVHNAYLLILAESGWPAATALLAIMEMLFRRAARAGPLGVTLFLSYMPLMLLDHLAYDNPQGLAIAAIWAGAILALSPTEPAPEPDAAAGQ